MKLSVPRPHHEVEIIVIDNNSSDDTKSLVTKLIFVSPIEMRYCFEGKQGLAAARNRAIDEAKGDYLIFLDDECIVEQEWLSVAISDFVQFRPCFIGGPYLGAFLPGTRPEWFKVEYGNAYFLALQYERGFQDSFRASGGNMGVRRDVFDQLRFDEDLGMKGDKIGLHEEYDLQQRFLSAHPSERTFYEPALIVRHFVLPHKMRLPYRAKLLFEQGASSTTIFGRWEILATLVRVSMFLALAPFRCLIRDRGQYPFWQNFVYERILPIACLRIGAVRKNIGRRFKKE